MSATSPPFAQLSPERVADAIESLGFQLATMPFGLNSYENRVYSFRTEDDTRWIAKFYRPERWSDAAIQAEHDFIMALARRQVAVAPLWQATNHQTLHHREGYRLAVFAQITGRPPALDAPQDLFALGERIGQLHAVAQHYKLLQRPTMALIPMATEAQQTVLDEAPLTKTQREAYLRITRAIMAQLANFELTTTSLHPLHGDSHIGNLLGNSEEGFTLVDFDDCLTGPAIQDLWMFLSGDRDDERRVQLAELIEGYEQYCAFDRRQLRLIEPLTTLRIMRHAAWLLSRWHDPAFPAAFFDIRTSDFWEGHLRLLEGQRQALTASPWWA